MRLFRHEKRIKRLDGKLYIHRRMLFKDNGILDRWFNVYLHEYHSPDPDIPHDHPFDFLAIALEGQGYEEIYKLNSMGRAAFEKGRFILKWLPRFYAAETIHAIRGVNKKGKRLRTIVVRGPRRRCWRFVSQHNGYVAIQSDWSETIFPWRGK